MPTTRQIKRNAQRLARQQAIQANAEKLANQKSQLKHLTGGCVIGVYADPHSVVQEALARLDLALPHMCAMVDGTTPIGSVTSFRNLALHSRVNAVTIKEANVTERAVLQRARTTGTHFLFIVWKVHTRVTRKARACLKSQDPAIIEVGYNKGFIWNPHAAPFQPSMGLGRDTQVVDPSYMHHYDGFPKFFDINFMPSTSDDFGAHGAMMDHRHYVCDVDVDSLYFQLGEADLIGNRSTANDCDVERVGMLGDQMRVNEVADFSTTPCFELCGSDEAHEGSSHPAALDVYENEWFPSRPRLVEHHQPSCDCRPIRYVPADILQRLLSAKILTTIWCIGTAFLFSADHAAKLIINIMHGVVNLRFNCKGLVHSAVGFMHGHLRRCYGVLIEFVYFIDGLCKLINVRVWKLCFWSKGLVKSSVDLCLSSVCWQWSFFKYTFETCGGSLLSACSDQYELFRRCFSPCARKSNKRLSSINAALCIFLIRMWTSVQVGTRDFMAIGFFVARLGIGILKIIYCCAMWVCFFYACDEVLEGYIGIFGRDLAPALYFFAVLGFAALCCVACRLWSKCSPLENFGAQSQPSSPMVARPLNAKARQIHKKGGFTYQGPIGDGSVIVESTGVLSKRR